MVQDVLGNRTGAKSLSYYRSPDTPNARDMTHPPVCQYKSVSVRKFIATAAIGGKGE